MPHPYPLNPPVVEKLTTVFIHTVSETQATPADGLQAIANLIVLLLANLEAEQRKLTVKRMKIGLPELAAEAGRLCTAIRKPADAFCATALPRQRTERLRIGTQAVHKNGSCEIKSINQ
jgi:hypothetical protein